MSKRFLIKETMGCLVTFYRAVWADSKKEALDAGREAQGELLGVYVGDSLSGYDQPVQLTESVPEVCFYPEPPDTSKWPLPQPHGPYDDSNPDGYQESDRDYLENNRELAVMLLDNHIKSLQSQGKLK